MLCPIDQTPAEPREFTVHNREVVLQQCPSCHGIWVEREYWNDVAEQKIAVIDTGRQPVERYATVTCPVDSSPLQPLEDLPPALGSEIRGCPVCHGVWFSAGQLKHYISLKRKLGSQESLLTPGISLRNFITTNLAVFVVAAGLILVGFTLPSITALPQELIGRSETVTNIKLALWFLVFMELAIWPIIFARDIGKIKRETRRPALLSYFWLAVVITTAITTFVITQL